MRKGPEEDFRKRLKGRKEEADRANTPADRLDKQGISHDSHSAQGFLDAKTAMSAIFQITAMTHGVRSARKNGTSTCSSCA